MVGLIIVLAIIFLIVVYFVTCYNGFIKGKNSVKEAFATMDVYLKKRWDLIPNLVNTVKGYAKHEKETLAEVINMRNGNYSDMSMEEKIQSSNKLTGAISKLFALAESYPELKANQNFLDLSNQLKGIENDIANSRKYYNAVVKQFNNKVEMFPSNIIASLFHFSTFESFEVADESERENVQVNFNE